MKCKSPLEGMSGPMRATLKRRRVRRRRVRSTVAKTGQADREFGVDADPHAKRSPVRRLTERREYSHGRSRKASGNVRNLAAGGGAGLMRAQRGAAVD